MVYLYNEYSALAKKKKKPSNEYANMYLELLLSKTESQNLYSTILVFLKIVY